MSWAAILRDFPHKPGATLESEFLSAAGVWITLRWLVMGNDVEDAPVHWQAGRLDLALIGMLDYQLEMRLLVECAAAHDSLL